jgi:hypothetical protein
MHWEWGRRKKRGEENEYRLMNCIHLYENRTMKSVEIILIRRRGTRVMKGVNQSKLYYKHIWKCSNETLCTTNIC